MTSLAGSLDLRQNGRDAVFQVDAPFRTNSVAPETTIVALQGRLHNRQQLADALDLDADHETGASLIGRAYERWGLQAMERLRGRFAIALWDARRRTLLLARDPIGLVPLYYHLANSELAFSSAVASLAARPGVPRHLDEAHMAAYVLVRQPDPTSTFLSAVKRLPPGHMLTIVNGQATVQRHYRPRAMPLPATATDGDYADALRERIDLALRAELPAGERVGIHLSGGLDSSALACLASRQLARSNGSLVAASSVLPPGHAGPEEDEERYLAALEQFLPGLRSERVAPRDGSVFKDLEDGFTRLWSPVNVFHYVDRALALSLRGQGARVVISGFGGDAGPSLRRPDLASVASPHILSPTGWFKIAKRAVIGRWSAIGGGSLAASGLAARYRDLPERKRPEDNTAYHLSRLQTGIGPIGEEFVGFHATIGLDLVLPYFDLDLLEFLAGAPARQFSLDGQERSLFRRAMAGVLPEVIRTRQDKHPYAPDFPCRLDGERASLLEWLATVEQGRHTGSGLEHYLDPGRLKRALGRRPTIWTRWHGPTNLLAAMSLGAARFITWFEMLERSVDEREQD